MLYSKQCNVRCKWLPLDHETKEEQANARFLGPGAMRRDDQQPCTSQALRCHASPLTALQFCSESRRTIAAQLQGCETLRTISCWLRVNFLRTTARVHVFPHCTRAIRQPYYTQRETPRLLRGHVDVPDAQVQDFARWAATDGVLSMTFR